MKFGYHISGNYFGYGCALRLFKNREINVSTGKSRNLIRFYDKKSKIGVIGAITEGLIR